MASTQFHRTRLGPQTNYVEQKIVEVVPPVTTPALKMLSGASRKTRTRTLIDKSPYMAVLEHTSRVNSLTVTPLNLLQKGTPIPGGDKEASIKILLKTAATDNDFTPLRAGELWLSIFSWIFPELPGKIANCCRRYSLYIEREMGIADWQEECGFAVDNPATIADRYQALTEGHLASLIALIGTLMGRQLNNQNYQPWMRKRLIAFGSTIGEEETEDQYLMMQPSLNFCKAVYRFLSSKREIRSVVFIEIFAAARSAHSGRFGEPFKTTLLYLQGTEMAMFLMIHRHILEENPGILAWQGLLKYADKLVKAYDRWNELGEIAPYCRLIYTDKVLTDFSRNNIGVFADVAVAIAVKKGITSITNYKGAGTGENQELVNKALELIKISDNSFTHSSAAVFRAVYDQGDQEGMRNAIKAVGTSSEGPGGLTRLNEEIGQANVLQQYAVL